MEITILDYIVFFLFVGGVALFGCSFYFKSRKGVSAFTKAEGNLPTWVVGMSIFATFVSSISFLGYPGDSFKGNWNPLVFSFSIPIATWIAALVFIPLYRSVNSVSAYHFIEQKLGYWARCYVAICYLLTQFARIGAILLLLALPINTMFGWDIATVIVWTGIATLVYSLLGGIAAVIWTDAIQGIILIVGAVACALIITFSMPEGPRQLFDIAIANNKFSLGSFGLSLKEQTFWVMLVYGLFTNLQNYGIDQNYVQRYMTTPSTAAAVKSTLFGGLLYVPVAMVFFYIGTALFAYYQASPDLIPANTPADKVFPWFIVHGLPTGLTGLVIASLFSAGMSTIATSINSSATIVLTDFINHNKSLKDGNTTSESSASENKRNMRILYATSFVVGAFGIIMGLLMMRIDGVLDAWWKLASIFSGGMLGLFLLSLACRTIRRPAAVIATIAGLLVIAWMSLSPLINDSSPFYEMRSELHTYLTIAFGTTVIFLVGFVLTRFLPSKTKINGAFK
jgi:transporter, SSS family